MKMVTIPVSHFQQNCSVVWCEKTQLAAVIDPGADIDKILTVIAEQGVTVDKILLTHGHLDHAGAAAALSRHTGVSISGPHKADAFWLDQLSEQAKMMGFPSGENTTPDRWYAHGDVVEVGSISLSVLHTPGHTPGHVCYFDSVSRTAWVGDVIFAGSVGRTDFPMSDSRALVHSCREILFPLGDDVRFFPGHGPSSTFGHEKHTNPFVGDNA